VSPLGGRPGRLADAMVGGIVWRIGACQPPLDTCLAGVEAIALEAISIHIHIHIHANAGRDGTAPFLLNEGWETLDHRVKASPCQAMPEWPRVRTAMNENPGKTWIRKAREGMLAVGSGSIQLPINTLMTPSGRLSLPQTLCFVAGRHGAPRPRLGAGS
jgi:hypothetical protein